MSDWVPYKDRIAVCVEAPSNSFAEKEAEYLKEWAKKPTSTSLAKFAAERRISASVMTKWSKTNSIWKYEYEIAKLHIAARREELLNEKKMDSGAFHRYQSFYDEFLNLHQHEEKDEELLRKKALANYEAKLKADLAQPVTEEAQQQFDALMQQISKAQETLKSSRTKNNKDKKS